MRGLADTTGCRRQYLLGYFGEELAEPCGNCDTCAAGHGRPRRGRPTGEFAVGATVEHAEWGPGVVMRTEGDRVVVLFEHRRLPHAAPWPRSGSTTCCAPRAA